MNDKSNSNIFNFIKLSIALILIILPLIIGIIFFMYIVGIKDINQSATNRLALYFGDEYFSNLPIFFGIMLFSGVMLLKGSNKK